MLQLFQSNRIEALVTLIASQIRNNPQPNPLAPETILVQSPGMSQWLKLQLAQQNSIAANINFPLPSSFIWQLYQVLISDVPKQSPFNKDRMAWRLYTCLGELPSDTCFQPLIDYVESTESVSHVKSQSAVRCLRRFKLAEKIADVFDNYLMYRAHWLEHWLAGHNDLPDEAVDDLEQVEWQAKLWRQCHELTMTVGEGQEQQGLYSRAELHQMAIDSLNRMPDDQVRAQLPQRLFIFGVTSINQQQLELFDVLSKRIDVQLFRLNPCQEYWGDLVSEKTIARMSQEVAVNGDAETNYYVTGNPLLASWGKVGRDNNELVNQIEPQTSDVFIPPQNDLSVLGMIQNDIFNLSFRGQQLPLTPKELISNVGKRTIREEDNSVTFNRCHSVIRELEVLKDQILSWFESSEVKPQDILVMVPDINQYAPYIDSVFGTDNEGANIIPYAVSDRSDLSQHPVLQAFLSLFQLPQSRFTATELVGLLEVPQIAHHFEVSNEDLVLIKQWLVSCHIKWGINKEHKSDWALPEFEINTWHSGLRSLFIGMSDTQAKVWHGTYADPSVEGLQSIVLGKLVDFVSYLVSLSKLMAEDCGLSDWQYRGIQLYGELFEQFDQDPLQPYVSQKITNVLSTLADYGVNGDFDGLINNQIVHHLLNQLLSSSGVNQSFIAGRVNFCSLMPMRSVPFDAICILGLNEADYPRQVDPISFDLVAKHNPRKGDRSRKLDDRYLFLEALCSARKFFYTSYLAFSVKDNSAMMPSLLLSELMEYVDDSFLSNEPEQTAVDALSRIHKLQPFDAAYYQSADSKLVSYNHKWFDVISGPHTEALPEEERESIGKQVNTTSDLFELEQLIRFWSHPLKYFYQTQLETRLEFYSDMISDTEVFQHDGLQKYQHIEALLKQEIFHQKKAKGRPETISGAYPHGQWGEDMYEEYSGIAQGINCDLQSLIGETTSVNVSQHAGSLELGDIHLSGSVELVNSYQVTLRAGKCRFVDKLVTWIRHLFLCCHQPSVSYIASLDTKWQRFEAISEDEAKTLLGLFIAPFVGTERGQPFFWHPGLATVIAEFDLSTNDISTLFPQLAKLLEPSSFGVSLIDDDYVRRHQESLLHVEESTALLTQKLVTSMLDYMTEAPPAKLAQDNIKVSVQ